MEKEKAEREVRIEEPEKEMVVPTVKEIMEKEGLSWEDATKRCIEICRKAHQNSDCQRKILGHELCEGCPKYFPEKTKEIRTETEWLREKLRLY